MPQNFVSLQGTAHGYALMRGDISTQESVVQMVRDWTGAVTRQRQSLLSATEMEIHIRPGEDGQWRVSYADPGFAEFVGVEHPDELIGRTIREVTSHDAVPYNIANARKVLDGTRSGLTAMGWLRHRPSGEERWYIQQSSRLDTRTLRCLIWAISAPETRSTDDDPQPLAMLDRIPMLEFVVGRLQDRLRDLAWQISHPDTHMVLSTAQERQLRAVAQNVVQEALLEFEDGHVLPLKKFDTVDRRGGAPPKYAQPDEVARQTAAIMASAEDFWGITVADVLAALRPPLKSRNSLIGYLVKAGCMREGDSLKDTLRRLGQEALQRLTVLAGAAITVGVNLTF